MSIVWGSQYSLLVSGYKIPSSAHHILLKEVKRLQFITVGALSIAKNSNLFRTSYLYGSAAGLEVTH